MKNILSSPVLRRRGLGGGFLIVVCGLFVAALPSHAVIKPQAVLYQDNDSSKEARDVVPASKIEKMTFDQYYKYIDSLDIDHSEAGYDDACLYYAETKANLHDKQAEKISISLKKKLRALRYAVNMTEGNMVNANFKPGLGTLFAHSMNRYCAVREDAIGDMIPLLAHPGKANMPKAVLLKKIKGLDKYVPDKSHPYRKLVKDLSSYPGNIIEVVYKLEIRSIDAMKQALSDAGG